jgi:hypothetical protein
LNKKWASQATGLDFEVFKTILSRFVKDGKILDVDNWIGLVNFHKHVAYRNASVAQGIVRLYREGTGCPQALYSLWLTLLNSTLLYLSDSEDKSSQLKKEIKELLMGWKAKHSDNDEDLPSIDLESRESLKSDDDLLKEKNEKKLRYKKDLVEWLITHQKIDRTKITQTWRNKQFKALEELYVMHTQRPKIIEAIIEYEEADWYKGDRPDFRSIVSKFEKQV